MSYLGLRKLKWMRLNLWRAEFFSLDTKFFCFFSTKHKGRIWKKSQIFIPLYKVHRLIMHDRRSHLGRITATLAWLNGLCTNTVSSSWWMLWPVLFTNNVSRSLQPQSAYLQNYSEACFLSSKNGWPSPCDKSSSCAYSPWFTPGIFGWFVISLLQTDQTATIILPKHPNISTSKFNSFDAHFNKI